MDLDFNSRTFRDIVCLSLIVSVAGIFIDTDHWFALVNHWKDARFLHSDPSFLVVYVLLWGLVGTAFAYRWGVVGLRNETRLAHDERIQVPTGAAGTSFTSTMLSDRVGGYRGDWFPTSVSCKVTPLMSAGIEREVNTHLAGLRTEDRCTREGSI